MNQLVVGTSVLLMLCDLHDGLEISVLKINNHLVENGYTRTTMVEQVKGRYIRNHLFRAIPMSVSNDV